MFRRHAFFCRKAIAKPSRWSRVRQAEGRRRKSDLRTQPGIDAEARLGTRFARLSSLQNASPAYAAVMAEYGYLPDVRKPSRAWSRTRAPRAVGRRGGGTSAALFSMVGAWLKKWLGWMDQDGMVVGWLSSG